MTDRSDDARVHLAVHVAVLCAMTLVHVAGIGSVIVNVLWFVQRPGARPLLDDPTRIGNLIAYVACGLWAVGGAIVAPVTAVGLALRRSWARTLAQTYWALSLLTVCCLPFCVLGLWSLSRTDVRRALEPPPQG